jgi:EmrB/QacA subfamily drug resistance transporter
MNRIIPLILAVALFMEQMDSTVISTALPAIAADLSVGPITLKLALTAYMVALAIFIPVSGWMADRYGAKNVFRTAIVIFVIGSILCAMAESLTQFVLFRFLQGAGGAMMTPVGRLVLLRTTERSQLVAAMAYLTIPALVGPMAGPPLGGFITTYFSWHWIFLINVPIGVIGIWLATVHLPHIETPKPPPMDVHGFLLVAIAASGVVFGLSVISLPALPPVTGYASVLAGLFALVLYLRHARGHAAPILDLRLFANPGFRAAVLGGSIFRISVGAVPFLTPLMLQVGFGLTPFQSGMITFAGAIGAISTKFLAQKVFAAAGFRTTLIVAAVLSAITTAANGFFEPQTPAAVMIAFLLMAGFTRSFFFTGVNALGYADIPDERASQATSMSSVAQQVSLALGVALAAVILEVGSAMRGGPLSVEDFHLAFFVVAALSLLGMTPFLALDKRIGAAVSGQRRPVTRRQG